MHITYLISQYPALSETFIAREMAALEGMGHSVTVARLRWSGAPGASEGLRVPGVEALPPPLNPLRWGQALAWAVRHRPGVVGRMTTEVVQAMRAGTTIPFRLLVLFFVSLRTAHRLRPRRVDHLRAHFLDAEGTAARWVSGLLDVPYSVTLHSPRTTEGRFPEAMRRRIVENAAFAAAISTETTAALRALDPDVNVVLVRNGLNLPEPRPSAPPAPPYRVLGIGRFLHLKGFDVLVRAVRQCRDRGLNVELTLLGDGPARDEIEAAVTATGGGDHVHMPGAVPYATVEAMLREAHVLAVPSRVDRDGNRDGLPTVLLEALAVGVPVVASRLGGIPDLVTDGETGRLVPPDDVSGLADALADLLMHPDDAAVLATAGRARVHARHNVHTEVARLAEAIERTA